MLSVNQRLYSVKVRGRDDAVEFLDDSERSNFFISLTSGF